MTSFDNLRVCQVTPLPREWNPNAEGNQNNAVSSRSASDRHNHPHGFSVEGGCSYCHNLDVQAGRDARRASTLCCNSSKTGVSQSKSSAPSVSQCKSLWPVAVGCYLRDRESATETDGREHCQHQVAIQWLKRLRRGVAIQSRNVVRHGQSIRIRTSSAPLGADEAR
jgi:hypothetical protein